jgi:hypothetical protein
VEEGWVVVGGVGWRKGVSGGEGERGSIALSIAHCSTISEDKRVG